LPIGVRPRSLKAIIAIYIAAFLIALIGVRTANYAIAHDALRRDVDRRILREVSEVIGRDGTLPDYAGMARTIALEETDHDSADLYFMLVDGARRRIAGKLRLPAVPPAGFSVFGPDAGVPGVDHGRAYTRRFTDGGALVVLSDMDDVDRFDALHAHVQLVGLSLTALIVIGGAAGIAFAISSRMRAMQRTVDAVIAGDLRSRIPLDGSGSEFDRQAAAFNRMLDRIETLMADIRHGAKDMTHELKTPIARLRSQAAALARRAGDTPQGAEIEALVEQTDRILDLFSSLTRLWEVERGARRARFATVDLAALVAEVIETLELVAEDAGDRLCASAVAPAQMRGDVNLLRQMLVNLVENAVKHTPAGTRITVSLARDGGRALLSVRDDGPGIPADQHEVVVRKFGRLDASTEGQGLGLALVDAIARLHDGTLRLEDATPGLRAVIAVPLA
jgi:signal transduction histidine kinase